MKSLTKAVLKTKNVYFQYPAAPLPQLIDVSIQCSLASRVAVVGVNGAGWEVAAAYCHPLFS